MANGNEKLMQATMRQGTTTSSHFFAAISTEALLSLHTAGY